jgi:iron(III) transport system substrate-binding protein
MIVDVGGLRSMHALVKEKAGRRPLAAIKVMQEDPAGVERMSEEIKARYSKLFGV